MVQNITNQNIADLFNAMVNSSTLTMWGIDTDMRISFFSQAFADRIKEQKNIDITKGMLPEEYLEGFGQWKDCYHRVLEGSIFSEDDCFMLDEEQYYCHTKFNPITNNNGKIIGAYMISQDMTRQKNMEAELKKINKDLKDMLYIASHDLQSPLVTIAGFTSLMLDKHKGEVPQETEFILKRIHTNVEHMRKLVISLLDISRINTQKNPWQMFDAGKELQKMMDELELMLSNKNIKVSVGDLPEIYGDKVRIVIVFRNLITNAVNYGAKHIDVYYDAERKLFAVKDDGIGIASDNLEIIFRPGHRLKEIDVEGCGMGLTFARKVVEFHNGTIFCESEGSGKGSTFYFSIGQSFDKI